MAKTYTAAGTVAAGDVATAAAWNVVTADVNNLIIPPTARILASANVSVANSSHTSFTGFTNTNATEDFDTDGMVTLSATASCMTIQTAGVYVVAATAIFASSAVGSRFARIVRSRAGVLTSLATSQISANAGGSTELNPSGIASFAVGDLIRLMVFQSSGGALNLLADDTGVEFAQTQVAATWIGTTS
jgi:hypothetical protein